MTKKKAKSPYAKYDKKPYRYSESLRNWRNVAKTHGASSHQAVQADSAWRKTIVNY